MANTGPIQVPSNLSNLKTPEDIVRFLSAFTSQMAGQFNNLLSTKIAWGAIGLSGQVTSGSGNFGCSLVSVALGLYHVTFREAYSARPAVTVTPEFPLVVPFGFSVGLSGFDINFTDSLGTFGAYPFSFIAMGAR